MSEQVDVSEEESIQLEMLIKSPVFTTLKKVLDRYKEQCNSVLLTTDNPNKMFETRGRIIGVQVIEKLPGILVQRRLVKQQAENKKRELEAAHKKRVAYPEEKK